MEIARGPCTSISVYRMPPQRVAERRLVGAEHRGVAHDDHVGVSSERRSTRNFSRLSLPTFLLALDHPP
jgi:hypothetical protein